MKAQKIIIAILASLGAGIVQAAGPAPAKDMKMFCRASQELLRGIQQDYDKYVLSDAIDLFAELETGEIATSRIIGVDTEAETASRLFFSADFADLVMRKGDLVDIDQVSALRAGDSSNIATFHRGVKAGGTVTYCLTANESREAMLIAETDASPLLTVRDMTTGTEAQASPSGEANILWTPLDFSEKGNSLLLKITNPGDKPMSFVIAFL